MFSRSTHLRNPTLHQQRLETQRRRPLLRWTALPPVLLHVHPFAEIVFDYEDGSGFAVEIGRYVEEEAGGRDVGFEVALGGEGAFGSAGEGWVSGPIYGGGRREGWDTVCRDWEPF